MFLFHGTALFDLQMESKKRKKAARMLMLRCNTLVGGVNKLGEVYA